MCIVAIKEVLADVATLAGAVLLGRPAPIRGRRRDRIVGVGCQRGSSRRVARPSRLHISDYRLPAIIDVDVLDADTLVSAVTGGAGEGSRPVRNQARINRAAAVGRARHYSAL